MPRRTSLSRVGSWACLLAGSAVAVVASLALVASEVGAEWRAFVPWWACVVAPPAFYVVVGLVAGRWAPARGLGAVVVLGVLHVALVAATATAWTKVETITLERALLRVASQSPDLTLLLMLAVPAALAPFRDLLAPRRRYGRIVRMARAPRAPSRAAPLLFVAPAPGRASIPPAASAATAAATPPLAAPSPAPPTAAAPPAAGGPRPGPLPDEAPAPLRAEPADEVVRVPFERILDQLPADVFLLPWHRVAENLREPRHILVPLRVVAPQLAEGVVEVKWETISDQFPGGALAVPDDELARRLRNGRLVLPIDEIVRQVPAQTFAFAADSVDVKGIEDFPPPFQPYVPPPGEEAGVAAPPVGEGSHDVGPAEALSTSARAPDPPAGPTRAADAATAPVADVPPAPGPGVPSTPVRAPVPADPPALVPPLPPPRGAVPPPSLPPLPVPGFAALRVESVVDDGARLVLVSTASVDRDAAIEAARRIRPFLGDARLPAPADQATVRGRDLAVILTPLAEGALAVAVDTTAGLALLEQWSLRAAPPVGPRPQPPRGANGAPALVDAGVAPHVRVIADTLRAFGRLSPSVLRDAAGRSVVYLFLPVEIDPAPIGQLAGDLLEAFAGAPLRSVTFRLGPHRLVVRAVERSRARTLLIAGGPVDRPGLARLEVERAARRLGER